MQFFHIQKLGYAFILGAAPSNLVTGAQLRRNTRMAKRHGGLWVGGSIELSPAGVSSSHMPSKNHCTSGLGPSIF